MLVSVASLTLAFVLHEEFVHVTTSIPTTQGVAKGWVGKESGRTDTREFNAAVTAFWRATLLLDMLVS